MMHMPSRVPLAVAAILFCCTANIQASDAKRVAVNIPQQPVLGALKQLGEQTGLQLLMRVDTVSSDEIIVQPLSGELSMRGALDKLLANTGLEYEFINDRTVRISRPHAIPTSSALEPQVRAVRVAQVEGDASQNLSTGRGQADTRNGQIEQVVVTASKRTERLIDTPQSVSVLSADALNKLAATQFRDFANTLPGLSFTSNGAGWTQITIRGVTAGSDIGQTVGVYVDDVPYGSSSAFTKASQSALDMGLLDVDRVEVLRGPQGTLYGASTLGGLVKYVSRPPTTEGFSAQVRTGLAGTEDGGVSYNGAVAINQPISTDRAALRASGFYSHDGGFVDNVARGDKDTDRAGIYGGRADLLLTPADQLSIRLTGYAQNIVREGESNVDYLSAGNPVEGGLDQRRAIAEPFDQRFRLASGTLTYNFGSATLTSISSYQTSNLDFVQDLPSYAGLCGLSASAGCAGIGFTQDLVTDKFTQEVRVASASGGSLEWLAGVFYTDESSQNHQAFLLYDAGGAAVSNDLFTFSSPSKFQEYAGFANLTWNLTEKFNITGGTRFASNRQSNTQMGGGAFGISYPTARSEDDVFTYLANARYHFNPNATGYLRYATGYRPGGPNFVVTDTTTGNPVGDPTFEPDRLKSYEAGYKVETADRRFGADVAVYYIDWSNIQINVVRGAFGGIDNAAGGARIRGAELNLSARAIASLSMIASFGYTNARLNEAEPDLGAALAQHRLPNVPRFSAALSADYALPLKSSPTIGATLRYVDERMVSFDNSVSNPQYRLPSYAAVDLRSGVTVGTVDLQLYVRNLLDRRGETSAYTWQGVPRVAVLQPRTFGLSAAIKF